jgi:ferrous iron transport protein B
LLTIALGGNPNCGKSALFNQFTGIRQKTGNWPGVTVDRKEGRFQLEGEEITIVDLPGIYSLDASSIDEQITRDYLLSGEASLIVNIIDAANLERNLYFTVQMREMGIPMVIALNMMDVARKQGIELDVACLSEKLGCPVLPVVAVTGEGLDELKQQIYIVAHAEGQTNFQVTHEDTVEQAITDLIPQFADHGTTTNARWLALKLLEDDTHALSLTKVDTSSKVKEWQKVILDRAGEEADIHIADARYSHAHTLAQQVITERGKIGRTFSDKIDKLVLNRFVGIPIFMAVMYLMFMFTINIGGAFIDFFDIVAGAIFVDGLGGWMRSMQMPELLAVIIADGAGGGVRVVATFIPIIACLYLFLSMLEDTGYMARAAFVMDRFMRTIGLPGKAFVPMIVGFGCNVPAVMATRTLENQRERKLTILMNPFMSCGARLPVYALFAAAFFPENGQNLVFLLYLIGITAAIFTGLIMRNTLLSGTSTGFMMELPPYHLPTLKGVALRTWDRVKLFILGAGRVIIIMVLVLNVMNSIGTDGSFGNQDSDKSVLSQIGQSLTPVFSPMGIEQYNWAATVGIFTGVLAKEAVVGTLDSIYTQIAAEEAGNDMDNSSFEFWPAIEHAFATIPENLSGVADLIFDPLGMNLEDIDNQQSTAESQKVSGGIFGAMASRFDGQAGAFAYLLFILLYFPCAATIGAISRETGGAWATFVACWTTGVAYTTSTLFYQIATFSRHPQSSTGWIVGLGILTVVVIATLYTWGKKGTPTPVKHSADKI